MVGLQRCLLLCVVAAGPVSCPAATYYVDASQGTDSNSGLQAAAAWRSLDRVNHANLSPGDRVLLRSGDRWQGQLAPRSSGKQGAPIVFDRYGEGALPRIDGGGTVTDAVLLRNVQQIELHHLAVTNQGSPGPVRRGVDVVLDHYGTARHIVLADLYIHDVNGTEEQKNNGGIIFRTLGRSRFDGLVIARNIVWRVDRSGIVGESANISRASWFPSLHVAIEDNYVADTGGDGIVPWATDGAVVSGNVAAQCNQRSTQYNAGIWQWSTRNTLLTMNEAFGTKGTRDGEGFDSDYNSRNTRFVRNYSHDNDGGFMLICTPVDRNPAQNIGNTGTVIRENISRNDKGLLINLSGADDVRVTGNLFYVGPSRHTQLIASNWQGWSHGARFTENSFFVQGTLAFGHSVLRRPDGSYQIAAGWAPATGIMFAGNHYFGPMIDPPGDDHPPNAPPPADTFAWSTEPVFAPSHPEAYPAYLQAHRAWMQHLFAAQFSDDR